MAKLHEILAVESDLNNIFETLSKETTKTFGKSAMFTGAIKSYEAFNENDPPMPTERQELVTTVQDKLEYLAVAGVKYFNATYLKDATNCAAKANLVINKELSIADVPATFLLGLESKLKKLQVVYLSIPTLQQGVAWEERTDLGKGVFAAVHDTEAIRSAKKFKSQVLYDATKEHPAQIEKWEEQVPVGKYITKLVSTMVTPARKSELLSRISNLIQATKAARQRANMQTLVTTDIGNEIFKYINK